MTLPCHSGTTWVSPRQWEGAGGTRVRLRPPTPCTTQPHSPGAAVKAPPSTLATLALGPTSCPGETEAPPASFWPLLPLRPGHAASSPHPSPRTPLRSQLACARVPCHPQLTAGQHQLRPPWVPVRVAERACGTQPHSCLQVRGRDREAALHRGSQGGNGVAVPRRSLEVVTGLGPDAPGTESCVSTWLLRQLSDRPQCGPRAPDVEPSASSGATGEREEPPPWEENEGTRDAARRTGVTAHCGRSSWICGSCHAASMAHRDGSPEAADFNQTSKDQEVPEASLQGGSPQVTSWAPQSSE